MAISSLSAAAGVKAMLLPQVRREVNLDNGAAQPVSVHLDRKQQVKRLDKLSLFFSSKPLSSPARSTSLVCSSSLNARCGAEGQTQTLEKPVSVIQNVPGKEKSPMLDDGGTGLRPRDDGGGGGGGGGGGSNYSGGFFFFGFLAFLGFLKDKETEGDYRDSRY